MPSLSDIQIKQLVKKGVPISGRSDGGGLTFTLSVKGTASWVFRYSFGGKRKELWLGNYPTIGLAEARVKATAARAGVQNGVDVAQAKQQLRLEQTAASSVKDLCDEYYDRMVKDRIKDPDQVRGILDRHIIHHLGKKRLADVKPMDIDKMIKNIAVDQQFRYMANRVLSQVKIVFNYACRRHWIDQNPAWAFKREDAGGEEKARKRALSDAELVKLFSAFKAAPKSFRLHDLVVRLTLVTLIRKSELVEAPWSEFDLKEGLWVIPKERIKTGEDMVLNNFVIPLPRLAIDWLEEVKAIYATKKSARGSDYVFPALKQSKREMMSVFTINSALGRLAHGIDHFTVHDLRRTARTHLSSLGILPHIAERSLNHKLPGENDTYDTYDYLAERRAALELWATKLDSLIKGTPFNVLPVGPNIPVRVA